MSSTKELPSLDTYSPQELEALDKISPAFKHYREITQHPTTSFEDRLRIERHSYWMQAAAATYFQNVSTQQVSYFLSFTADKILQKAFEHSFSSPSLALFALGKLGAEELNLSSDVDLIFVSEDNTSIPSAEIRNFQKSLHEVTDFGFCFRLDFNLRPGGAKSPLIISLSQFQNHYGSYGETWERLALARLRPIAGPPQLLQKVRALSESFVYRKHLDYTLLEDLNHLRSRISFEYPKELDNKMNVKMAPGGIRDIELFFIALQVLHGGREAQLRTHSTHQLFKLMLTFNKLPKEDIYFFSKLYWELRHHEHMAQLVNDRQTHFAIVSQESQLRHDLLLSEKIVSTLLGETPKKSQLPLRLEQQQEWLKNKGFNEHSIQTAWPHILQMTAVSKRQEKDEEQRLIFLDHFLQNLLSHKPHHDHGLQLLEDFIKSTRAKASFFTLLNHHPEINRALAKLFSISPMISHKISSRPELIDSFFLGSLTPLAEDLEEFLDGLSERKQLIELISSSEFMDTLNTQLLWQRLSEGADDIAKRLLFKIDPNESLELIAMGKWGGQELGLKSDLDFIFCAPHSLSENEHKLARKFTLLLTEPHKGGSIYNVDLRLRPAGPSSPIITSRPHLLEYLAERADIWERMAYLKARSLKKDFSVFPSLAHKKVTEEDFHFIESMIQRIHTKNKHTDFKTNKGGLLEVELRVQLELLAKQLSPTSTATFSFFQLAKKEQALWAPIEQNYYQMRLWEQVYRLCSNQSTGRLNFESSSFFRMCSLLRTESETLKKQIIETLEHNTELIKKLA